MATPMKRETREITSLGEWLTWRQDFVTASGIGALFNIHPHLSLADLVAEKRGERRGEGDNPSMRAGRILEPACIAAVNEAEPSWHVVKATTFHILPELRLACTPDAFGDDGLLVQCKTVSPAQWDQWHGRAPLHYLLQTLCELLVTDRARGILAMLIRSPSFPLYLFDVPRHQRAEQRIMDVVGEFWRKWDAGEHPVTQSPADLAELLDDDSYRDLSGNNELPPLLAERAELAAQRRQGKKRLEAIDYILKNTLGPASTGWLPGWQLSFKSYTRREMVIPEKRIRVLLVKATAEAEEDAEESAA
jgi:predicted phage-related endonuclease